MKILIIGAGFTGLTAAYELLKAGHAVTIIEKEDKPGGLAVGFKVPGWDWTLERHYHHWFANDEHAIKLIKEVGLGAKLFFKTPRTDVFVNGKIYPFTSPLDILLFPPLSPLSRLRLAAVTAYLKLLPPPLAINLEKTTAYDWLKQYYGQKIFSLIWKPLLDGKFGPYADQVNMAWFWARIYKRTPALGYLEGGYQALADRMDEKIRRMGGKILYGTRIQELRMEDGMWMVEIEGGWIEGGAPTRTDEGVLAGRNSRQDPPESRIKNQESRKERSNHQPSTINHKYDTVLSTAPSPIFAKLFPNLPKSYQQKISATPHLHALNLVLITNQPILKETYWLNINEPGYPFLALVQHTNFASPKHYGGNHILYIGNYLPPDHPFLSKSKEELLAIFEPYLRRINPEFRIMNYELGIKEEKKIRNLTIRNSYRFLGPFAQPVMTINYSKRKPVFETPLPNVYLANMDMVYPWDRGTNYAIELGKEVAKRIAI